MTIRSFDERLGCSKAYNQQTPPIIRHKLTVVLASLALSFGYCSNGFAESCHVTTSTLSELSVGRVGSYGDLKVRLNEIRDGRYCLLDLKAPSYTHSLELRENSSFVATICNSEVTIKITSVYDFRTNRDREYRNCFFEISVF